MSATNGKAPPFAQQRLFYFGLLFGMTAYMIAAAIVLQSGDGKGLAAEPIAALDTLTIVVGFALAAGAFAVWRLMKSRADKLTGEAGRATRFAGRLFAIALLEGGCLFGTTVWMLNGKAVPGLVTALVLLATAIAIVPLSDPDASS